MDKNKINEALSITLGILSIIAIIALLVKSKFETNELLGSIVDFTQVAVPVLVLLVATTLKKDTKSFGEIGKEALTEVQKKNADTLSGPRYNRENYDPEKGKGKEYLFIKKNEPGSKLRAKFIPVEPLNEGVLAIYIQKATLVYGLNYASAKATEEEIKKIQSNVTAALKDHLDKKYSGLYEVIEELNGDMAITIDFSENELGKRKFQKAISECTALALSSMVKQ